MKNNLISKWEPTISQTHARIFTKLITRVMNTKLTLTLHPKVIARARLYAKVNGQSLSSIVENYLKTLTAHPKIQSSPTPLTKSLVGVIKSTSDHDWKAEWTEGFTKKHGI